MKAILQFVRMTVVGGILFLVPIVLASVLFQKALTVAGKLVHPLASRLREAGFGPMTPMILSIVAIVLFCFLAGLFARTSLASRIVRTLEDAVLSRMPGYAFIKSATESKLGVEGDSPYTVVLVRFDDTCQIAFQVEEVDGDRVALFIPDAPDARAGSVHFVMRDRVEPLGMTLPAAMKCLKGLGAGSGERVRGALASNPG